MQNCAIKATWLMCNMGLGAKLCFEIQFRLDWEFAHHQIRLGHQQGVQELSSM